MLNLRNAFFRNVAHGVMALLGMKSHAAGRKSQALTPEEQEAHDA